MCIKGLRGSAFSLPGGLCTGLFSGIDCESDIAPEGALIWCRVKVNGKGSLQSNQSSVQAPHSDEIQSIETIK